MHPHPYILLHNSTIHENYLLQFILKYVGTYLCKKVVNNYLNHSLYTDTFIRRICGELMYPQQCLPLNPKGNVRLHFVDASLHLGNKKINIGELFTFLLYHFPLSPTE